MQPAQAAFRQRYLDALAVAEPRWLPWVDTGRVTRWRGLRRRTGAAGSVALPSASRCAALNRRREILPALVCPDTTSWDAANFAPLLCRAEVLLGTCLMDEYAPRLRVRPRFTTA